MLRSSGAMQSTKKAGAVVGRQLTGAEAEELRTRTRQALLAVGMLIAGTANTITCKASLSFVSEGQPFDHPFVMAGCMFCGEILCLVWHEISLFVHRAQSSRDSLAMGGGRAAREAASVPKHIFALPALCDILGTSIMYVGLTLTSASTYQMLRGELPCSSPTVALSPHTYNTLTRTPPAPALPFAGSVIIFTGALSATYLRRKQWGYHWVAMALVFAGVLTVGSASTMMAGEASSAAATMSEKAGSQVMLGNALVVISQLFTALQMCLEERFVTVSTAQHHNQNPHPEPNRNPILRGTTCLRLWPSGGRASGVFSACSAC